MSGTAEQLDLLRFPLSGSRLIEASAGSGKTFTIALLYVRLVLGHGREEQANPALAPPEILVVTFTEAATQELRDRIRARLSETAEMFLADPDTVTERSPGEDLLHDLRAEYPPEQWAAKARQLQWAAEWMDEAAVSTIHSWCHRMLREHAFDSGSLFTQTLETDQSELLAEAVRDYWRTFFVPLPRETAATLGAWWPTPEALQQKLKPLLEHPDLLDAAEEPKETVAIRAREKAARLAALKAPWAVWLPELRQLLDAAVAEKRVDGRKLQARYYQPWLDALGAWAAEDGAETPNLSDKGWERLTPDGLRDAWKQGEPPDHPALTALVSLRNALDALPSAHNDILRHAARWVTTRFAGEQRRRAQMGFNDLLTRLRDALRGPNGERLAALIRRQFPVALIDEFQDTDPVQYSIFDAVYRVVENAPETALILIGDPKQAIYAFRGADIFTYLQARQATAGRHYTLKRNHRSTQAMVAASNRCFEAAEAREEGAGAFLFRTASGNPVPFVSAVARGRKDLLEIEGGVPPALTVWYLPPGDDGKALGSEAYRQAIAESCASEMARLLKLGQSGQAGFSGDGDWRPLRSADLAVLVNSRTEADAIRRALARRGVRSVYLSDRESVFQSPQAAELRYWLEACAEPDDPYRLRAALATATLGLDWDALDTLNRDEAVWEGRVMQFRAYWEAWRRQGVLPMLRRLLTDFGVPVRCLGAEAANHPRNGERVLTDLLHLAEILQAASATLDGEQALIRHLAEQIRDSANGMDPGDRQLRLESDADLVQVVTIHKSKGLEYPLVFLPFASWVRPVKPDELPLKWHDDDGRLRVDLEVSPEALARADRERLGEDLRKLYVALTRARHAVWLGVGVIKEFERGALGYLMNGGEPVAASALAPALTAWLDGCPSCHIQPAPVPGEDRVRPGPEAAAGPARASARVLREYWWVASFSALKKVDEAVPPAFDTPHEETFQESLMSSDIDTGAGSVERQTGVPAGISAGRLHGFPRGPSAGTFLHDLLEWAAAQGFAEILARPERLRDQIARRCQPRGWSHWIDPLAEWLGHFLAMPLRLPPMNGMGEATLTLGALSTYLAEMEFWLAIHATDVAVIDARVTAATLDGDARPALEARRLNGLLKGFIDLVIEHDGRYYVLDYKSNWLGESDAAYTPEAMRRVILEERYEVQYVLYLLALHRQLRARLPDYQYDRHVGGAIYIFLRGTEAPGQGLHVERPPAALIEGLDALIASSSSPGDRP
ncbi:MAG: exodeoxyribonuclease V subunit beta [Methylococcus sp.]